MSVTAQCSLTSFVFLEDVPDGRENVRRPSSPSTFYSRIINCVFCKRVTLPNMRSEPTRSWQHMCRYGCQSSSALPVHIPAHLLQMVVYIFILIDVS